LSVKVSQILQEKSGGTRFLKGKGTASGEEQRRAVLREHMAALCLYFPGVVVEHKLSGGGKSPRNGTIFFGSTNILRGGGTWKGKNPTGSSPRHPLHWKTVTKKVNGRILRKRRIAAAWDKPTEGPPQEAVAGRVPKRRPTRPVPNWSKTLPPGRVTERQRDFQVRRRVD